VRPHSISFATYDRMQEVLSPARLEIIKSLVGKGALAIHEVAQRAGREVEAVRDDITRLVNAGIIERDAECVRFDYDGIELS